MFLNLGDLLGGLGRSLLQVWWLGAKSCGKGGSRKLHHVFNSLLRVSGSRFNEDLCCKAGFWEVHGATVEFVQRTLRCLMLLPYRAPGILHLLWGPCPEI